MFTTAGEKLSHRYLVCAGNHDRHVYGNAFNPLRRGLELIQGFAGAPSWFEQAFNGHIPTISNPIDLNLSSIANTWRLRILGIDTSSRAQYSAQGFATLKDLERLPKVAREGDEADLVIMMHHHHLLSIAELESERQTFGQLFKPTVMHNAGTVLAALAEGHVNIVLHGHEHHRAAARYGGVATGPDADTIVLGAGSCTGNGLKGCETARASYNVLELYQDRSVHVQERRFVGGRWKGSAAVELLDSRTIRRSRFYRRTKPDLPPRSTYSECFQFHLDRSIDLTQAWTNWEVHGGVWRPYTTNTSGLPDKASVRFDWRDGRTETVSGFYGLLPGSDHTYWVELALAGQQSAVANRIVMHHRWVGGAVLTKGDLAWLSPVSSGSFRSQGREVASTYVSHELQSLSMLVRLPERLAPAASDVEVLYSSRGNADFQPSLELGAAVRHHAPGLISLEIPYPLRGYTYALTWPVAPEPEPSPASLKFRVCARAVGADLLGVFARGFPRLSFLGSVALGLYLPDGRTGILAKAAEFHISLHPKAGRVPDHISFQTDSLIYRLAWWGQIHQAVAKAGEYDSAFMAEERAIAVVPIRRFGVGDGYGYGYGETWGIVRVGVYAPEPFESKDLLERLTEHTTLEVFADGVISLLDRAKD